MPNSLQTKSDRTLNIGPHPKWHEHCQQYEISFERTLFGEETFDDIMAVRTAVLGGVQEPDDIDEYSHHYLIRVKGAPSTALRVTRRCDGPLDCEEYYPEALLGQYREAMHVYQESIGNASRFVTISSYPLTLKLAPMLVEAAWRDQIHQGTRLDVMNVHERAVRYYGRMGYALVANSFFRHPKLDTPSRVMVLPASPAWSSSLQHVFQGIEDPFPAATLEDHIEIEPWPTFRG